MVCVHPIMYDKVNMMYITCTFCHRASRVHQKLNTTVLKIPPKSGAVRLEGCLQSLFTAGINMCDFIHVSVAV